MSRKIRNKLYLSTKELSLIAIFSSIWITSQIYFGPIIGQITEMHGMINRLVGWLLMLILAELTGKFGRVSIMAAVASLATRMVRLSSLEGLIVGLGYALGGLTFDLLFFLLANKLEGKIRIVYIVTVAIISGAVAFIPYLMLKFSFLGLYGFIAWLPINAYRLAKDFILSTLGVFIGLPLLPRIKVWSLKKE